MRTGVHDMTRLTATLLIGRMRNRALFELMTIGADRLNRSQLCRLLTVKLAVTGLALPLAHGLVLTAAGQNILMAGCAGHGHGRTGRLGYVGRMTARTGRQLSGGMAGKGGRSEHLTVTALTDIDFGPDQLVGVVAAMTIVAQTAFAFGHLRMGLGHHQAVIAMAGIARLGLCSRQKRSIGIPMKRRMALGAALLGKRLVRKAEIRRHRQIGMAGHTAGAGHLRRLRRRIMRRMTARTRQLRSLGMGSKTTLGIDRIGMAYAAQDFLRLAQQGRLH